MRVRSDDISRPTVIHIHISRSRQISPGAEESNVLATAKLWCKPGVLGGRLCRFTLTYDGKFKKVALQPDSAPTVGAGGLDMAQNRKWKKPSIHYQPSNTVLM
jgi:hypothetical protein